MNKLVDHNTILACQKGKSTAFKLLYEGCAPYVLSIIKRYVNSSSDYKDLMQEIFARVFLKINSYDSSKGEFKFWLRRVSVNQCLMHYRDTKWKDKIVSIDSSLDKEEWSETPNFNLSKEEILQIISPMPSGYRVVFMMIVIDGYKHDEVAKELGITPETSRSQLTRAKKWLRKSMSEKPKELLYGLL